MSAIITTTLRSKTLSTPQIMPPSAMAVEIIEPNSMWELAKNSAAKVAVIAATLSAKESQDISRNRWKMPLIKHLGELAGYLLRVSFVHDKFGEHEHGTGSERVYDFLKGLEQLCAFMCPPQAIRNLNTYDKASRFPILSALQLDEDSDIVDMISTSLKAFVFSDITADSGKNSQWTSSQHSNHKKSSKSYVQSYFAFLKSFSSTKDQVETAAQETQADIAGRSAKDVEIPDDFPAHVHKALYTIIKKYSRCCCAQSGGQYDMSRHHEGRLRLQENAQFTDEHAIFDTVFSRNPHGSSAHSIEWQHLQFQIPKKQRKKGKQIRAAGRVAFHSPTSPPQLPADPNVETVIHTPKDFCSLLQKRAGPAKICLQAHDTEISELRNRLVLDDDIAHEQSISLDRVLRDHDPVAKKRLLLAYMLAKSFWQYYDSDWMNVRWTTTAVQFFHEPRVDDDNDDDNDDNDDAEAGLLDESPYLTISLHSDQNQSSALLSAEHLPTESVVHRYPRLLALGTLLLEIGRKKRRRDATSTCQGRSQKEVETIEERISTDLNDILSALRRKTWPKLDIQEEARQTCRIVLKNCSNPKLFDEEPVSSASAGENGMHTIEERRAIIYRRIVYPLKHLLEKLGWVHRLENVQRQADAEETRAGGHGTKASFLNSHDSDRESSRQKAQDWLLRIQTSDVTKILFEGFKVRSPPQRIRIAVLDTGYDPNSIFFRDGVRKRRIQMWRDMTTADATTARDEQGHGTHVLSLLMKVIPAADFYVARVARNTGELADSISNVARAIKWASEEHHVDIISMSFGFDGEIRDAQNRPAISNAISNAMHVRDQQILFFAAAANEGGNQSEMFPASHPQVIAIRGTDDKGWLQRYNPPKGYTGMDCFMTLGQDVPGAGLSNRDGGIDVYHSGTSVSTPIAAGIAGILLSYARLYGDDLQKYLGGHDGAGPASRLATVAGMRRMLTSLSTEMLDGYYYLSAEAFLRLPTHGSRIGALGGSIL
ncbi:hypothetical protein QBC43DRAFT_310098 [Cladorrhinum sp. PSN259]|nr:hypothetical protein QBC43DRAFT_310098 [Cladorrhinum sp. PSN259]